MNKNPIIQKKAQRQNQVLQDTYRMTHTTDVAIFGFFEGKLRVLLVKRGIAPYENYWMLPGGAVKEGETLEMATAGHLNSLLGINDVYVQQLKTYSSIDRHPVKRVITTGFYALVKPQILQVCPQQYIQEAVWTTVKDIKELGFDHKTILDDALKRLRQELLFDPLCAHLVSEKFTLSELQSLYEAISGKNLDRRNFRRKLNAMNLIKDTKEKRIGVKGGPLLFSFNH